MSNDQPKTKRYRVEAALAIEVFQWVHAESGEEALRVAAEEKQGYWEIDKGSEGEPYDLYIGEEEEECPDEEDE